jgi:hypothetical protein
LKQCAAKRKRRLSALPNVGPYIYDVKISDYTRSSIYTTLVGQGLINPFENMAKFSCSCLGTILSNKNIIHEEIKERVIRVIQECLLPYSSENVV